MTDAFLDKLATDLKPVKPMRMWPLWLMAGAGLGLAALFVIFAYQPRPEMLALGHGVWPAHFAVVGKPLLFLITGLSALWSLADLVRPEGRLRPWTLAPVALLVVMVLVLFGIQYATQGAAKVGQSLVGGDMLCFQTILLGGAIAFALLWGLWLRKTATSSPITLGALSGLAAASLMAVAYAIHCNMDAPAYMLLVYGAAVAAFTGVAALIGGRLFKW
jgi:hypothetical protein